MSQCAQCQKEMEGFKLMRDRELANGRYLIDLYFCKQPQCPNFRLVQVEG